MPITATFPNITFPHRGVETKDAFVLAQETAQDSLSGSFTTNLNTFKTEANALEVNVNAKEASAIAAADLAIGSANYQGEWEPQGYTKGESVSIGTARFSCKVTHTTPQSPPNETYWLQIYGIDDTTPSLVTPYSSYKTQALHNSQAESIANLASASLSIANSTTPVFDPISTTPTDMPFTVTVPTTNSALLTVDDTANTITFLKNGTNNFFSSVTFQSSTTDTRTVTFNIVNANDVIAGDFVVDTTYVIESVGTTDFTLIGASANTVGVIFTATGIGAGTGTANAVLGSEVMVIETSAGGISDKYTNTLITVGSNGLPSAPLTIKIMASVDSGATIDLLSFSSTLSASTVVNDSAIADAIHSSPAKTTLVDADLFGVVDSEDSFSLKRSTWGNIKSTLLSYLSSLFSRFTIGQKWQNVTGSRSVGTVYTATGNAIAISIGFTRSSTTVVDFYVNAPSEAPVAIFATNESNAQRSFMFTIVPEGHEYELDVLSGATIHYWRELRI